MPDVRLAHNAPYSAAQMFDLVINVDDYHKFIPYCVASQVVSRKALENGDICITADLTVAYKIVNATYRSEITAAADKSSLVVRQTEGLFKQLHNQWQFADNKKGCVINFELEFDFSSYLIGAMLQPMMPMIVEKFITCFTARADEVYGK